MDFQKEVGKKSQHTNKRQIKQMVFFFLNVRKQGNQINEINITYNLLN